MIRQNGDKRKAEIREEDFYDTSRKSALLFEARRGSLTTKQTYRCRFEDNLDVTRLICD